MGLQRSWINPGHVEKTNDRDYEVEERYESRILEESRDATDFDSLCKNRRYRTMESAVNRLQKEAKGYLDSLRGG